MGKTVTPVGQYIKNMLARRNISMSAFAEIIFFDRQLLYMLVHGQCSVPKSFMLIVTKRMCLSGEEKQALAEAIAQTPDVPKTKQAEDLEDAAIDVCIQELLKFEAITKDQASFINTLCDENERLRRLMVGQKGCA